MNFPIRKKQIQQSKMEFPELIPSSNKPAKKELNFAAIDFSKKVEVEERKTVIAREITKEEINAAFDENFNSILIKLAQNWQKHKQNYIEFHGLDEYNKTYLMPIDDY